MPVYKLSEDHIFPSPHLASKEGLLAVGGDLNRERLLLADVPKPFRGNAVALLTAGLMSLAFMGFAGLIKA